MGPEKTLRPIAGPERLGAGISLEKTPRPAGPDEKRETVGPPVKGPRLKEATLY